MTLFLVVIGFPLCKKNNCMNKTSFFAQKSVFFLTIKTNFASNSLSHRTKQQKEPMPPPVIKALLILAVIMLTLYYYAKFWKKKASLAFLLYGRSAQFREERKWAARWALIAGHKDAAKLYALACPEVLDKELPLKPFYRKKIKCVFADYYYSQKYHNWIAEDQWSFSKTVYLFKEGKDECGSYFTQAFKALDTAGEITFMFMPCSSRERYLIRFTPLAKYLLKLRDVRSGLDYITFTGTRDSKHTTMQRDKVDVSSNYIIDKAIQGKRVIIVDDLLTTGKSLTSYAEHLRRAGAEVTGAIFLAKTFMLPSDSKVKWSIWKQFFLSW